MSAHPLPSGYSSELPPTLAGLGAQPLRVVARHADPDALALAKQAADRRAAASARPVPRGTSHDPGRHRPSGLHAPIDGQLGLFSDPAGPTQLALFGEAVPANEGEL
jgi:hypothetical protein